MSPICVAGAVLNESWTCLESIVAVGAMNQRLLVKVMVTVLCCLAVLCDVCVCENSGVKRVCLDSFKRFSRWGCWGLCKRTCF